LYICRVGQNHIYTVYIRYFWQGNHQIYGHIRCVHTVLANPIYMTVTYESGLLTISAMLLVMCTLVLGILFMLCFCLGCFLFGHEDKRSSLCCGVMCTLVLGILFMPWCNDEAYSKL